MLRRNDACIKVLKSWIDITKYDSKKNETESEMFMIISSLPFDQS